MFDFLLRLRPSPRARRFFSPARTLIFFLIFRRFFLHLNSESRVASLHLCLPSRLPLLEAFHVLLLVLSAWKKVSFVLRSSPYRLLAHTYDSVFGFTFLFRYASPPPLTRHLFRLTHRLRSGDISPPSALLCGNFPSSSWNSSMPNLPFPSQLFFESSSVVFLAFSKFV